MKVTVEKKNPMVPEPERERVTVLLRPETEKDERALAFLVDNCKVHFGREPGNGRVRHVSLPLEDL